MIDLLSKYTTDASRFMVINNTLIHYRVEGKKDGPTLVLLHGAFSSLHTFNDWMPHLVEHFKVIRLDLIGFGLTGPNPQNDYTVTNHVRYLHTFLNRLEVENCYIAGSSLGGWVAWEYTLKYSSRIKKLILLDAAGFVDAKSIPLPFKMARTPLVDKIVKYVIRKNVLEQFVKQVYCDKSKVTPQLVDRYFDLFTRKGNPEAFFHLVNGKFRDHTPYLKNIKQPTLILWGEQDEWLPVKNAHRFYNALSNATQVIYHQVGHLPMEEVPLLSVGDTIEFLND